MLSPWLRHAAPVRPGITKRLEQEFNDWASSNPNVIKSRSYTEQRGPISYWPHVEDFLKENYPASHKGVRRGMEDAGSILHYPEFGKQQMGFDPYETGPEAVAKHGYDPAEVVAGMLLLHNSSSPQRGYTSDTDVGILTDIVQKRQQMQRNYEQRTQGVISAQD